MASRRPAAVRLGSIDQRNIASPATCGEAIDVPVLSPAREPNRCEYTSVPTAAIVPALLEFVPRQPGSNSGEPVSTRFSTASVLRRAGIGWPNAFSRSGRTAAADQRLFVAARPPVLPADVACTIRSSSPAEPFTSCPQSEPSSCAWRSVIATSGPRLVFTTTRPVRAFASWMIRTPVIWYVRPIASITCSCVVAGNTPVTFPAAVPLVAKREAAMPATWYPCSLLPIREIKSLAL